MDWVPATFGWTYWPTHRRPDRPCWRSSWRTRKLQTESLAAAGFAASYREFVSLRSARHKYRKLFLSLADQEMLPALFHCTTGKDRTGWAAAALLTLLGVPKDVVVEDYLRSNDYILPMYQGVIDGAVANGIEKEIPLSILGVK